MVALVVAIVILWPRPRPLEKALLATDFVTFIGEAAGTNAQSAVLVFLLPNQDTLAMRVQPGDAPNGGGEFWIDRDIGFNPRSRLEVEPGTPLGNKLVYLLQTATLATNFAAHITAPPSRERLDWARTAIQKSP